MDSKSDQASQLWVLIIGACVAPSAGKAGRSLPLSLALLAIDLRGISK